MTNLRSHNRFMAKPRETYTHTHNYVCVYVCICLCIHMCISVCVYRLLVSLCRSAGPVEVTRLRVVLGEHTETPGEKLRKPLPILCLHLKGAAALKCVTLRSNTSDRARWLLPRHPQGCTSVASHVGLREPKVCSCFF